MTANLHSALLHLRPANGDDRRPLWIDAICINQNDREERSQQVAMMREIYASATQVIIWLGEGTGESDAAFNALPYIVKREPSSNGTGITSDENEKTYLSRQCGRFFLMELHNHRPWLWRVWILQELAMAKGDPLVVCGWKSAPWAVFIEAWQVIANEALAGFGTRRKFPSSVSDEAERDSKEDDKWERLSLMKLDVMNDLRQAVRARGGENLMKLLMISRTSAAADPRDRIYGLLGLLEKDALNANLGTIIPIDYNKSCTDVYIDAMVHIFSHGKGPYYLSGAFLSGGPVAPPSIPDLSTSTTQPFLPSWVPDFSCQVAEEATQPPGHIFHPPTSMHASGAGADAQNGKVLEDGRTLQVEGLFVDTIDEVVLFGSSLSAVFKNLVLFETRFSEAINRSCSFNTQIAPFMQRFKKNEPMWRILISNKNFKSGYDSAPISYEGSYLDLLNHGDATAKHSTPLKGSIGLEDSDYMMCLKTCVGNKSLFTTESGFIGTCVPDGRKGDIVTIIFGSPSPFILRPILKHTHSGNDKKQIYRLIGASYVGGIMNGEMVDELYCEDLMDSSTFFVQ